MTSNEHDSAVSRVLDALERVGCNSRRCGRGWVARCPGHEDHTPSLSIAEGRDGRVLLRCWAGCDTRAVLEALGLRWADLFAGARAGAGRGA